MNKKKLILFGLLLIVASILYWFFNEYISLAWIQTNSTQMQQFVAQHYPLALMLFFVLYAAYAGLSLPGASLLTIAAGFLFKLLPALIVVNVAATVGATCAFLLSRYIIGDYIQQKYSKQLHIFNTNIEQYGHYYVLISRLILLFPFFVVNTVAGVTNVSLKTFIWTTSLGIVPGSLVYILAGQQLSTIASVHDIVSWRFIIIMLLLALLILLPVIYTQLHKKNTT